MDLAETSKQVGDGVRTLGFVWTVVAAVGGVALMAIVVGGVVHWLRRSRRKAMDALYPLQPYRDELRELLLNMPSLTISEEDRGLGKGRPVAELYVRERVGGRGELERGPQTLAEVLAAGRSGVWAVVGEPGAGKSLMLQHHALVLLAETTGPVPIFIRLGDKRLRPDARLKEALVAVWGPANAEALWHRVEAGNALVLLDGRDEVGTAGGAAKLLSALVSDARGCQVVYTGRPIGFPDPPLPGHVRLDLQEFDRAQQLDLLGKRGLDRAEAEALLDRLEPKLRRLARNPLVLTMIALTAKQLTAGKTVRRTGLYDATVHVLLDRRRPDGEAGWDEATRTQIRDALAPMALAAHGTADEQLDADLLPRTWKGGALPVGRSEDNFLWQVAKWSGLLFAQGEEGRAPRYSFPHRTFQEYLAAVALSAQTKRDDVLRKAKDDPGNWSEVLGLTCGLLEIDQADDLLREVIRIRDLGLLVRVIADAEQVSPAVVGEVLDVLRTGRAWEATRQVLEDLPELVERAGGSAGDVLDRACQVAQATTHGAELFFAHRALAALAAGKCGALPVPGAARQRAADKAREFWRNHRPTERRAALEALDAWGWGEVPAGDHRLGSGRDENNPPRTQRLVRPFEMGAVPVVNAVYELFDPGHRAERGAHAEAGFPVVNVTWYEATAFAAWLAAEPGRDRRERLPTEVEWELGARGGTATEYWSGDAEKDFAKVGWYSKNSGGRAHRVGELPANAYGLRDVHGNVDEWCADAYDAEAFSSPPAPYDPADPPVASVDPGAGRVDRGGSWVSGAQLARSSFRGRYQPIRRFPLLGVRLVRAPAPPAGRRR